MVNKKRLFDLSFIRTCSCVIFLIEVNYGSDSEYILCFSLRKYFPLHPEKEMERERLKDELIKADYRYMMEEAERIINEQYSDEFQYTDRKPPQ